MARKKAKRNPRNGRDDVRRDSRSKGGRGDRDLREDSKATAYGGNDISWYSRNPNLLVAAASIPYPYRVGMNLPLLSSGGDSLDVYYLGATSTGEPNVMAHSVLDGFQYQIPGVCRINWIPSLGKTSKSTDPVNMVARELYATIRSKYSGALEVDPPDLMMYLGALDSIFAYIAALKRIYRILSVWTPENYLLPDGLLRAMVGTNTDFDAVRAQKTQLWQCINELILQTRKFKCPAVMDLFNRHYWLNDNVYTDAPSVNSQMYVLSMEAVLVYEDMPTQDDPTVKASGLVYKYTPWSNTGAGQGDGFPQGVSVTNLYTFGLSMIKALNEWDDVFTINGYLQRAFESIPSFAIEEMVQDPVFTPIYNEEVLTQIENVRPIPHLYSVVLTAAGVNQNVSTNCVVTPDSFTISPTGTTDFADLRNMSQISPIVNIRSDNPTVADTVIATRLCHAVTLTPSGDSFILEIEHATEIVTGVMYTGNPSQFAETYTPAVYATLYGRSIQMYTTPIHYDKVLDAFDWHPICIEIVADVPLGNRYLKIHGDTRNITTLVTRQLGEIHRVCVLSEFNAYGNTSRM